MNPSFRGKGIPGFKSEPVLEQLSGGESARLHNTESFSKPGRRERLRNVAPEVKQQMYVGDEEFVETFGRKAKTTATSEKGYPLQRIINSVSEVTGG